MKSEHSESLPQLAGRVWNIPRASCGLQGGFGTFREPPAGCREGLEHSASLLRVAGRDWNIPGQFLNHSYNLLAPLWGVFYATDGKKLALVADIQAYVIAVIVHTPTVSTGATAVALILIGTPPDTVETDKTEVAT